MPLPPSPTSCDVANVVEIMPNRLYWLARRTVPKDTATSHFFSIDGVLRYDPFCADFGPLSLGLTFRYCKMVEAKLNNPNLAGKRIIHCCLQDPRFRANAACLMCLFQVVVQRKAPEEALRPFSGIDPPFFPFRDAIDGPCSFQLTILDCLEGMHKALELGWFDMDEFDLCSYESLGNPYKADATWVIPEKFVAFAGPYATPADEHGCPCFTPEDCVPIFRSAGIGMVVRLNNKQYDRRRFTDHGIRHSDLYFPDGSCPPWDIMSKFLSLAEMESGPIAVHCKAGLGRTCTLIGLYAMKHFAFPARAFIGWTRLCRPGSILGPQQQFLVNMQNEMFRMGAAPPSPRCKLGCKSEVAKPLACVRLASLTSGQQHRDMGQGERLCNAKRVGQAGPWSANCRADDVVGCPGLPKQKRSSDVPSLSIIGGDDSLSTHATPLAKPKRSHSSAPSVHAVSALCKEDIMDGPGAFCLGGTMPKAKLPPLIKKPVSRQISVPDLLGIDKIREQTRMNPVSEKENGGSSRSR
mmetsp:Transcript_81210/g.161055  ORF Transcript_81210/g.161055 Transcript_81210/m.161055 type:complete len:523 (+) Transcript_81210:83-1651(+)